MREGAKGQESGDEGMGPRKKWMKKGRVRAALIGFSGTQVSECGHCCGWWERSDLYVLWNADVDVVLIVRGICVRRCMLISLIE